MRANGPSESESLTGLVTEVVGGLGHLVALHIRLARSELTADLGETVRAAKLSLVMAVPVVVGYALVMVGAALWIGGWIGRGPGGGAASGFAVVGGVNVLLGLVGAWRAMKGAEAVRWGDKTSDEVRRSVEVLTAKSLPAGRDAPIS